MKKIKMILTSLFVFTMAISVSSCGTEDIIEMFQDEYYIVLDEISSNLVNPETNESLNSAIYNEFAFDKGGKSQSLGKSDIAPLEAFEKSCENIKASLQQAYNGKMPSGGWITYVFSLRKDSPTGSVQMTKQITIQ